MIIRKVKQDGTNWLSTNIEADTYYCMCKTLTGRILVGSYNGIYYSDDNGDTWTHNNNTSNRISAICVLHTGKILAAIEQNQDTHVYGIFSSNDNGDTWVFVNEIAKPVNVIIETTTGRILIGGQPGLWYSDDACVTVSTYGTESDVIFYDFCNLASGRIFGSASAPVSPSSRAFYVCYSDDNGITWRYSQWYNIFSKYAIYVDPNNVLYMGGRVSSDGDYASRVLRSSDEGTSVEDVYTFNWGVTSVDRDVNAIFVTDHNRIIVGRQRGIWYSDDNGATWVQSNITSSQVNTICNASQDRLLALKDVETVIYSDPVIEAKQTKYLDQTGAQELVTQAKAYVDSLV